MTSEDFRILTYFQVPQLYLPVGAVPNYNSSIAGSCHKMARYRLENDSVAPYTSPRSNNNNNSSPVVPCQILTVVYA
jgi:hypothetical protein